MKSKFILACLLLFSVQGILYAQTIIPPTVPDRHLQTVGNVLHVDGDIVSTPLIGEKGAYLAAVSRSNTSGGTIWLMHSNGAINRTLSDGARYDQVVAMGDDPGNLGKRYQVVYAYRTRATSPSTALHYIAVRKAWVEISCDGKMIVTPLPGFHRVSVNHAERPSIDFFPKPSEMVDSVTPSLQKYALTWDEGDDSLKISLGNTSMNAYVHYRHTFYIGNGKVIRPSVSATHDINTGKDIAHVAYIFYDSLTGVTGLYHAEVDVTSITAPNLLSTTLIDTGAHLSGVSVYSPLGNVRTNPSIESMGIYDSTKPAAKWNITIGSKVYTYNSLIPTGYDCTTISGDTSTSNYNPVAAGIGTFGDTSNIGNKYYTIGWKKAGSNFLSQYVDATTGLLVDDSVYYRINNGSVSPIVSLASASNTGNGLLAAWYDGSSLWYKVTNVNEPPQSTQVPTWPATSPQLSDTSLWVAGTNGRIDWVNTDRYNLYLKYATVSSGYLQAVANDFYDSTLGTYRVVVTINNSITNTKRSVTINNARHPDIVILDDHPDSLAAADTPDYRLIVVFEDVSTSNNQIKAWGYILRNPYDDTKFGLTQLSTNPVPIGNDAVENKCPHIDGTLNETATFFPSPDLTSAVITWAENDGGWKIKAKFGGSYDFTGSIVTIDNGENPDVAYVHGVDSVYANFVYYNSATQELKYQKYNSSSGYKNTIILASGINVTAPPRIEAFNIPVASDVVKWHVVAEVQDGSEYQIYNYRALDTCINFINYSVTPVLDISTSTESENNNPLYNNNGYSPCVAAGNGPETFGSSNTVGNESYALGWWIENGGYNALSIADNGLYQTAKNGYAKINTNTLSANVGGSGKCRLALSSGSNDGAGLVAAWVSDSSGYPRIIIKSSNSFSFKPSFVKNLHAENAVISVYPNPANSYLHIVGADKGTYVIADITGKMLLTGTLTIHGINIESLTRGIYLLKVIDKDKHYHIVKFLKN